MDNSLPKYITELIGTFFLVLTIGLSRDPFAIGSMLMVMVYMGGHISGAHYNPAVSFAAFLLKKLSMKDLGPYVVAQLVGALLAAIVVKFTGSREFVVSLGSYASGTDSATHTVISGLIVEVLFTFALVLVILNVAVSKRTQGNHYFGLAIGFTVGASATAAGGISGGAFNPAVGVMADLFALIAHGSNIWHIWIYVVGPLAGAFLATLVFRMQEDSMQ